MSWRAQNGAVLLLSLSAGCADLTRPTTDRLEPPKPSAPARPTPREAPKKRALDPPAEKGRTAPAKAATPPREGEIGASHILIAYKGSQRARPTVTRSKQEARALARSILARVRQPGASFEELARSSSDGPSGPRGGALGRFTRRAMVKPFSDAAFALAPGEVSGVVETVFGFHIIKRTE